MIVSASPLRQSTFLLVCAAAAVVGAAAWARPHLEAARHRDNKCAAVGEMCRDRSACCDGAVCRPRRGFRGNACRTTADCKAAEGLCCQEVPVPRRKSYLMCEKVRSYSKCV